MTSERARAYRHVMILLSALAPARLDPAEAATVRDAADALLFTDDVVADGEALEALGRVEALLYQLVGAKRLVAEAAEDLLEAVEGCGPNAVAA
jgi:hypothetical protein